MVKLNQFLHFLLFLIVYHNLLKGFAVTDFILKKKKKHKSKNKSAPSKQTKFLNLKIKKPKKNKMLKFHPYFSHYKEPTT